MKFVKCYGGPSHRQIIAIEDGRYRVEFAARRSLSCSLPWGDEPISVMQDHQRLVYYLRTYRERAITLKGAIVYKDVEVLLYEDSDLTRHEQWDMEHELRELPWKWVCEPSFLHEFDQWFEWRCHENGWEKVKIRW